MSGRGWHPLLERQLRRLLPAGPEASVEPLLAAVSAAYAEAEQDRKLADHTLAVIAEELTQANERLRQETETRLRESEERYRHIFDSSPETIVLTDMQAAVTDINKRGSEYFGLSGADPAGRRLGEVLQLAPAGAASLDEALAVASSGGRPAPFELEFKRPDGARLTGQVHATVLSQAEVGPVGLLLVITDITARKQAEERLRETMHELERFNRLMAGRERRMLELKKQVNDLCAETGRAPAYRVDAGTVIADLPPGLLPALPRR